MKPVRLSPKAEEDLEEIGDYIARDNPGRAITFTDELVEACHQIGLSPNTFPLQPHIGPEVRRMLHGRYSIFYKVLQHEIRIERVVHGARNISAIVFDA